MKKTMTMFALVAASMLAPAAFADVTFGASVTNANGSLTTTLTWSAPGSSGCTASGHASWTGSKPASGTQTLPAITLSGSYTLTLACAFPGTTQTTISWTAPTTNTDGTSLAKCPDQNPGNPCLLQFKVFRTTGTPAVSTDEFKLVDDRNATSYVWTSQAAGAWNYYVTAVNGLFAESPISNVATKTLTGATSQNASVTLTVNPIPGKATNVTAT